MKTRSTKNYYEDDSRESRPEPQVQASQVQTFQSPSTHAKLLKLPKLNRPGGVGGSLKGIVAREKAKKHKDEVKIVPILPSYRPCDASSDNWGRTVTFPSGNQYGFVVKEAEDKYLLSNPCGPATVSCDDLPNMIRVSNESVLCFEHTLYGNPSKNQAASRAEIDCLTSQFKNDSSNCNNLRDNNITQIIGVGALGSVALLGLIRLGLCCLKGRQLEPAASVGAATNVAATTRIAEPASPPTVATEVQLTSVASETSVPLLAATKSEEKPLPRPC